MNDLRLCDSDKIRQSHKINVSTKQLKKRSSSSLFPYYPIMTSTLSLTSTSNNRSHLLNNDLGSESSHSEAAQVYHTWQAEEDDMQLNPGVVSDEEEDVFMQLEEDEGLLPSNLDDFYDNISQQISSDETINMMLLSMPAVPTPFFISSHSTHCIACDSFLHVNGVDNDRMRFQSTFSKLTESMRRSQETRRSLYARTPGLKDYKRLGSVERVLQSVEFSTHHICKAMISQ
jgi:hypothetical protein